MNIKKKSLLIAIVAFISVVVLMIQQVSAVSDVKIRSKEYFSVDITKEKLEMIVKSMNEDSDNAETPRGNLLCALVGHSKATGEITTIEHNYYSTAPKCRETISKIEYCTRSDCDYYVVTSQTINRLTCH